MHLQGCRREEAIVPLWLILLWVPSAEIRSWVTVSSIPRFLWYHCNHTGIEAQGDKGRTQKPLFSIVAMTCRGSFVVSVFVLQRPRDHSHFNEVLLELLCPCTRIGSAQSSCRTTTKSHYLADCLGSRDLRANFFFSLVHCTSKMSR